MNPESGDRLMAELKAIPSVHRTMGDYSRNGCHFNVHLHTEHLLTAAHLLFDRSYFLEDITGVDVVEGIMLVYHFDHYATVQRFALHVRVPHAAPKAPSLAAIFSGADWHERECFDFFGVEFENHPDLKPLLLPDDLDLHPLIKGKDRRSLYALLPLGQVVEMREAAGSAANDWKASPKAV